MRQQRPLTSSTQGGALKSDENCQDRIFMRRMGYRVADARLKRLVDSSVTKK